MMDLKDWTSAPLGELVSSKSNSAPDGDSIVWNLSLDEIEPVTGRVMRFTNCRVDQLGSSKCCFDERHVLYSKLRPYLNKVVVPEGPGVGTSELVPMLPLPGKLDREYLAFYLRSRQFVDFAKENTRGANLPRIAMSELWKHQVSFPTSLKTQRRIVSQIKTCLNKVTEVEQLRNESIQHSKHLAASLYAAISRSGHFPKRSVGDVISVSRNGRSIRQDNENANGYVLSLRSVHDVTLNLDNPKPIVLPDSVLDQYGIQEGDVFVSRSNTRELVGLSSVALKTPTSRLIYPDLLIKLTVDPAQVLPRYLAYVLRTPESRMQIRERAVGTSQSMVKISAERLKQVMLPVPSMSEQKALVSRFDELHELATQIVSEMRATEQTQLRDAILRKAFAGEL